MIKRKQLLWCSIVALCAVLLLAGVSLWAPEEDDQEYGGTTESVAEDNITNEFVDPQTFVIDTPYCQLQYPLKWRNYVRVEINEDDNYTVCFYGKAGNAPECHLFDVVFGESTAYRVGSVEVEQSMLTVGVEIYDIADEDEMTAEERLDLLSMCEDVNTVIRGLENCDNFIKD